jgi:hypothetical protein
VKLLGSIISIGIVVLFVNCAGGVGSSSGDPQLTIVKPLATIQQADSLWAGRVDSSRAKLALDTYVELSTRHFFSHTAIHKDSLFMEGYEASQTILKQNPKYNNLIFSTGDETMGIRGLEEKYIDVLYWGLANYGRWLETKGPLVRLGQRNLVITTLEHINDLDSNYYHAAYFRYKGALLARDPSSNLDTLAIKEAFESAVALAPEYLGNYTFMAEYYCPLVSDKDLFYKLLTTVITAKSKENLPYHAENMAEKKRADKMMMRAQTEAWF